MTIQIDTREHKWELARVQKQLTDLGAKTFVSKLYVGDYQSLDNPRLAIDRKKNLLELCSNVCQQHDRFRNELIRARDAGIQLIILCEESGVHQLEDVYFWENPRKKKSPKATSGQSLYRALITIRDRYNVRFEFCQKKDTGKRIMELLEHAEKEGQGMDKAASQDH